MKDSKIQILELRTVSGTGGGPEKTIFLTAKKINSIRFQTHIIYTRNKRDPFYNLMKKNWPVPVASHYQDLIEKHSFDFSMITFLKDYCLKNQIDILHSHEYKTDVLGWILKKRLDLKWVSTFHLPVEANLKLRFYQWLAYHALRRADLVMTVSATQKPLLVNHRISVEKIRVLPNGVDTNVFQPKDKRMPLREKWSIPYLAKVLGFLGRLDPQKNIPFLLQAFEKAFQKRENVVLVLGGEGPEKNKIEKIIQDLNLNKLMRLIGFVDNPVEFYSSIDVFILPSLAEGMPNSILEAMSMEVPVIATNIDGVPELIEDGEQGFLIPVGRGSENALIHCMVKLVENPSLQKEMGKKGRIKVLKQFSFDQRVQKLENIYEELCQR